MPKSADELAKAFLDSSIYKEQLEEVRQLREEVDGGNEKKQEQFHQSARAEKAKHLSPDSSYNISYPMQVRYAITRRVQLTKGDLFTVAITTFVSIFQALIIGSVFFDIPKTTAGFFSRGGVIFFAILFNALTGMAEIPAQYAQRPIVVRQRRYAMARPSADAFAQTLVDMPVKFITILCFDLILYWMTGLAATASQFFVFLLFTTVASFMMTTYFVRQHAQQQQCGSCVPAYACCHH